MTASTSVSPLRRTAAAVTLACGIVAGVGACSFAFGDSEVDKASIETEIAKLYKQKAGVDPSKTTCEDDLKGEVGASIECAVKSPVGLWQRFEVKATSVDGDKVNYNITTVPGPSGEPTW